MVGVCSQRLSRQDSSTFPAWSQDPSLNMSESSGADRAEAGFLSRGLSSREPVSPESHHAALGSHEMTIRPQGKGGTTKLSEPSFRKHGGAGAVRQGRREVEG